MIEASVGCCGRTKVCVLFHLYAFSSDHLAMHYFPLLPRNYDANPEIYTIVSHIDWELSWNNQHKEHAELLLNKPSAL